MGAKERRYAIRGMNLGGQPRQDWTKAWWQWFYSIEEKNHPAFASADYNTRNNDYNQGRVPFDWPEDAKNKVWFLAGAYGSEIKSRSIIPAGQWEGIFAPAYNMGASVEEFPSMSKDQILDLVRDDVDGVGTDINDAIQKGNLEATLDGEDYTANLERIKTYDWFKVNLVQENVLDLDVDSLSMISDGYWICVNPPPGDHILRLRGKSKNYNSDMTFNLTVRGPSKQNSK